MEIEKVIHFAVNYGLGVTLSIAMAIYMGRILKYVLRQNEIREERLALIISKDIVAVNELLKDHDNRSVLAIRNIEEIHSQNKKAYEKIQEENDNRRQAQVRIITAINQINTSLAYLNNNIANMAKSNGVVLPDTFKIPIEDQ